MRRPGRYLLGDRRGAVAVEFALILPVALMMIFFIIEVGRVLYDMSSLQFAVEKAGRYAMVEMDLDDAEVVQKAELESVFSNSLVGLGNRTVDTTCADPNAPPDDSTICFCVEPPDDCLPGEAVASDYRHIQARTLYTANAPFLPEMDFAISGTVRVPLVE